jgi:hypothetical protein
LDEETAVLPIGRCRRIVVPGRRRYRQVSRRLVGGPDGHWTWRRPGFGCKVIGNLALLVKPEYRTDPAFPASHPDKPLLSEPQVARLCSLSDDQASRLLKKMTDKGLLARRGKPPRWVTYVIGNKATE